MIGFIAWGATADIDLLSDCTFLYSDRTISLPDLSVTVYGPIRSMHTVSHGVMVTSLSGSLPYFFFTLFESLADGTGLYELTDICLHIDPVKGCCHGLVHPVSSRMT